jgi:hypothetical protein
MIGHGLEEYDLIIFNVSWNKYVKNVFFLSLEGMPEYY